MRQTDWPDQLSQLRLRAPHLKKNSAARILCLVRVKISLLYEKAFCQPRHTGPKGLQSRLHGNWPCQNTIRHTPPPPPPPPDHSYIDTHLA